MRHARPKRVVTRTGIAAWTLAAAVASPATSDAELPFRGLDGPTDRFSVSAFTRPYEVDLEPLLSLEPVSRVDPEHLDRHGRFPHGDVPWDSTGTHQLRQWAAEPDIASLTPEEKHDLAPPGAGVRVGVPSAVAVTGTLLGGLGLLVKVISAFF